MSYKLKSNQPNFQVAHEGKFYMRRYRKGVSYNEVPPEDLQKFEEVKAESPKPKAQSSKEKEK